MSRNRLTLSIAAIVLASVMLAFLPEVIERYRDEGLAGLYYTMKNRLPWASPNVHWETATAESHGMDTRQLDQLRDSLIAKKTQALLVVRDNKIIYEYYSPSHGANKRHYIASMSKAVAAGMVMLIALTDDQIGIDDYMWQYIPEWRNHPLKKKITVRQLVSHSSGIERVNFFEAQPGWEGEYLKNPKRRFRMAIETAPIVQEPGSGYHYSGVGFYVLAYAVTKTLQNSETTNIKDLLTKRIMSPLAIPQRDWEISYGESYEIDGMKLYEMGGGGAYTARAIARVGQLLLQKGEWQGKQLFARERVDAMLRWAESPSRRQKDSENPATGMGVWVNYDGYWKSVPRDAVVGAGAGHQILLVIPSLNLVAVRLGGPLGEDQWDGDYWRALESKLLQPLVDAIN